MPEAPTADPENPEISAPSPAPPTANNRKLIILLVVLVIIGFSATSLLIGYLIANQNQPAPPPPAPAPPTTAPAISPPPQAIPTLPPNPKGNTYRSDKLKLAFYYAAAVPDSSETFAVSEIGTKVYVYPKSLNQESGQSVEVFSKDTNQTLEQAITQRFLNDIAADTCFVTKLDSQQTGIEQAIIDFPIPTDTAEPFYISDACPTAYSRANGIRYFYYDPRFPDKFFYFDIGQYGIPAYNDSYDVSWQDTFTLSP